jgi:hypothetical protein
MSFQDALDERRVGSVSRAAGGLIRLRAWHDYHSLVATNRSRNHPQKLKEKSSWQCWFARDQSLAA